MKLARSMTSPEDDAPGLPALSADSAPLYIEAVKRGKKVLDRIEKGLKLFAQQNPVDLGGGRVYGEYPFPCDEWNVQLALPILVNYFWEEAYSTIKATILKKNIENILRERKKTNKDVRIGKDTELVIQALKNQGAVTTRFTYPVGEHKPKPAALMEGSAPEAERVEAPADAPGMVPETQASSGGCQEAAP